MPQISIQIPDSIAHAASEYAKRDQIGIDQFISLAIASKIGSSQAMAQSVGKAISDAQFKRLQTLMNKGVSVPPIAEDTIPDG